MDIDNMISDDILYLQVMHRPNRLDCGDESQWSLSCNLVTSPSILNAPNDDHDHTFNCYPYKTCTSAVINCPQNANCIINCYEESCTGSIINCPMNGECDINCGPDIYSGYSSCTGTIIHGSTDGGVLNLFCSGLFACSQLSVHAEDVEFFNFTMARSFYDGGSMVYAASFWFPSNENGTKNAFMNLLAEGFRGNSFYALNGWLDIEIYQNDSSWTNSGTMYCNTEYVDSCNFASNGMECISTNTICDNPVITTSAPTLPTSNPSVDPTTHPTTIPTVNPTSDPTMMPTREPSTDPTNAPTNNPSNPPTGAPTASPTYTPSTRPTVPPAVIYQLQDNDEEADKAKIINILIGIFTFFGLICLCICWVIWTAEKQKRVRDKAASAEMVKNSTAKLQSGTDDGNETMTYEKQVPSAPAEDNAGKDTLKSTDKEEGYGYKDVAASAPLKGDHDDVNATNKVDDYMKWNDEDILEWIMELDDGLFVEYKKTLQQSLKEENVRGVNLVNVDKMDIKIWGVIDIEHRRKLFLHIQSLVNTEGK